MKKAVVLIVSFIIVVLVLGMGSKTEAEGQGTAKQQISGVTEEVSADGVKTITINLSEIDESKLPEKYEAEVILEAPVYSGYVKGIEELGNENKIETTGKSYTKSGVFFMLSPTDGYPDETSFDIKIDDEGNIYILDILNSRIQKFNSKGKHIRNIPIKDAFRKRLDKVRGMWETENKKDEIEVNKDRIYVRDKMQNKIEALDEDGKVLEVIDVPEKIDGKNTREMKMWADEEGVGVGGKKLKIENGKVKMEERREEEKKNNKEIINNIISFKKINTNIKLGTSIIAINKMGEDKNKNIYFKISAGNKKERGILKISEAGQVRTFISDSPFWWDNKWKNGCDKITPFFNGDYTKSVLFSKNGTVYLIQSLCCKTDEECISKIRIIALKNK